MPSNYQVLEIKSLNVATTLCHPDLSLLKKVTLEDPATLVMTDLLTMNAATTSASASIDDTEELMKKMRVKLLFIVDARERIIGLITYNDIIGERPIQFQQLNGLPRSEICVLDIMTCIEQIEVLDMSAILKARVGDIVMTMQQLRRQHALVMETIDDQPRIRGIFSSNQISQQLGTEITTTTVVQSFAELGKVLGTN